MIKYGDIALKNNFYLIFLLFIYPLKWPWWIF